MSNKNIACPHCNQTLAFSPSLEGKTIKCPFCNGDFIIQTQAPRTSAMHLRANDQDNTFNFVCPYCGHTKQLPMVMNGKVVECDACCEESIAVPATEKECPFCGETIKFNAKFANTAKTGWMRLRHLHQRALPVVPVLRRKAAVIQTMKRMFCHFLIVSLWQ